ncbi:MAG: ABC transporter ATP-binding protein [Sphaerobacter sp.]|nr:ABC transporter ATP-binding protein [Sphaerobacter sp.]
MPILELNDVHAYYGHIHALKGVSLSVEEGEIVTLIGANGAGKSTTLRTISGLLRPRLGSIRFQGQRIDGLPPHRVAALRIGHAPEGRRVFPRMTVRENLEMGAFLQSDPAALRQGLERVFTLFPRLQERERQAAGTLSGGEQQMLAIGRALMSQPRILLLDEPSMGLAPTLVELIFDIIVDINRQGTAILLVEQNAHMALSIAHRGYVIQTGQIILSDTAEGLQRNELVRRAYLGEESALAG